MSRLQKIPQGIVLSLLSLCLTVSGMLVPVPQLSAQVRQTSSKQRSIKTRAKARPHQRTRALKTQKVAQIPVPKAEEEAEEENEFEDVEGRQQWFNFERSYPFGEMPSEGRRTAWETIAASNLEATAEAGIPTWQHIGPMPTRSDLYANWGDTSGRINSIAISPANPQIVLVGASTGGVWRSEDGGETFKPVSDNQIDLAVGYIAFAPSNPHVVYAGMGDAHGGYNGSGVLRSTDAGKTWARVNNNSLPSPGRIFRLEVDPNDANRVYVAQYTRLIDGVLFSSGFYYSTDGGVNWKRTLVGLPRDLVIHPTNAKIIYAGMARVDQPANSPAGLYRSTDGGETWARIYTAPYTSTTDIRAAVTPSDPNRIYIYLGGFPANSTTRELRLVTSKDGGQTWENRVLNSLIDTGQFGYNTYFYADPARANTLYIGTRDIYKSIDGGATWANLNNNFSVQGRYNPLISNAHPDQHALAFLPGNSNVLFIGNDGGLYKSTDAGKTFQSRNQTLSLSQFVGIAINPGNPRITLVGAQDNGTQMRFANGQWEEIISGDGGQCTFSPTDPNLLFTTYVRGDIYRFRQVAFNRQVGSQQIFGEFDTPRVQFYPPFASTKDGRLYFGSWRLFLSRNQGVTWYTPGWGFDLTRNATDTITTIGVSDITPNIIYTGSSQGRVMITQDDGESWSDITAGLPNRTIKSITTDPKNPAIAYLTVSGYLAGHVWKTTNYGASWKDVSGNLPDIPTNAFVFDPLTPGVLYVGTDIGVFRSTNDGQTWEVLNQGMPPVIVTALASHPSGIIQAATYGRGVYELNLKTNAADDSLPQTTRKEN
ncbi:MAG: exo-alpha-sialidase [Acidobacteria bacterium]|nr:exo-alpha-sialidase [Acidobacteriota bacterium]